LSIRLLGSFQVSLGGEPVTGIESDKVRALLAYLAVEAGQPHRRERLAGLLWPDLPEQAARNNLRVALANLRKVIGDLARPDAARADPAFLSTTRQTIQLNPAASCWIDVTALTDQLEARGRPRRVIRQLAEAVELYRGGFLEGLSLPDSREWEEWVLLKREQLQREVVAGLRRLAGWHERRGEYQQALPYARRQVSMEPWQEHGQRQVMRLLALTGQRNAAIAQYQGLVRMLAADLGVEPEDETEALYRRIREGQELRALAPGLPHNLPNFLVPLAGRESELDEIHAHLQNPGCRLLNLVGPGGSGKTRMALEVAADLVCGAAVHGIDTHPASHLADGVFFVSLAQLRSAEEITTTVADALGLTFGSGHSPFQQLLGLLRRKQTLLILDSFEHLLEGGADWVTDVLKAAPGVQILVTSRSRLNLHFETPFPVARMAISDEKALAADAPGALRQLGPYEIIEEIDTSIPATVYRAYQPAMDRYVAVKVINASLVSDVEAVARFQREAHLVARLEHPHILPVYDFDGAHEPPYIVMRYVEGGTICDLLARGPMPLEEVAYLIQQIGSALHYAHGHGIVHRDVKPDNVLIDTEGNAFVSDFGIADIVKDAGREREPLTEIPPPLGTPGYIAPERIMGRSDVDERADVYALGAMLYEMVTGALPFQARDLGQVLHQHLNAPVPDARALRPELPPALNAVIQQAMAKEPGDRYRSAAEFAAATTAAIGGRASQPSVVHTATRESR
jgi:DNA-binding SARP family transcriptional activator